MKRIVIPAAVVATAVLVFAVMNATAGRSRTSSGATVHVVEHAITGAVTNRPKTDKAGNVLTFANPVYDSGDAKKVGSDSGFCVRIVVKKSWECLWTTFLSGGQITVEGRSPTPATRSSRSPAEPARTASARGSMDRKYYTKAGTKFDFVFHISG